MMPPCIVAPRGFWCFFTTLANAVDVTITLSRSGRTCVMVPRLPMSLPASTTTSSPLRTFKSQHLRCERHDPHEPAVAKLAPDRSEGACASRLHLVVDEHGRVLVEADVAAVGAALLLLRTHD